MKKLLLVLMFAPLVSFGQVDLRWQMPKNLSEVIFKFNNFGNLSDDAFVRINAGEEVSSKDYYNDSEAIENLIESINYLEAKSKNNKSVIEYLNAIVNSFKATELLKNNQIDNSVAFNFYTKSINHIDRAIKLNPAMIEFYDLKYRLFSGLFYYDDLFEGKLIKKSLFEYHKKYHKKFLKHIDHYENIVSESTNEINLAYLFASFDGSVKKESLTNFFEENAYTGHLTEGVSRKIGQIKVDIGLARFCAYLFEKKYEKASLFSKFWEADYNSVDSLVSYNQKLKILPNFVDAITQYKAGKYDKAIKITNALLDDDHARNPFRNGEEFLIRYVNDKLNEEDKELIDDDSHTMATGNFLFDFGYGKKKAYIAYNYLIELEKKEDFISERDEIERGNVPYEELDIYTWRGDYILASYCKGLIYEKLNKKEKALKAFNLTLKLTGDFNEGDFYLLELQMFRNLLNLKTKDELKETIISKIKKLSI